jgi:hypothetical protein
MESRVGGSVVRERLDNIRESLMEYFGQQNELAAGLNVKNPITKPDVLLDYERCKQYGVLLYGGGLYDQPHLWLLEQDIVQEIITLFNAMPKLTLGAK